MNFKNVGQQTEDGQMLAGCRHDLSPKDTERKMISPVILLVIAGGCCQESQPDSQQTSHLAVRFSTAQYYLVA